MASQMAILSRARKTLLKTLNDHNNPFKASISTFTFLSLEAQLVEPSLPPPSPTPLPPNPASGARSTNQIDAALRYVDLTLKSGYMLSMRVFAECVRSCVNKGRLDALVSIIKRCKSVYQTMDQNKALSPSWNIWIARGENARGHVLLSVDEGLVVSTLGTGGRTYSSTLRAFSTLHKFETAYRNSPKEAEEDIFSPFTSLHPLGDIPHIHSSFPFVHIQMPCGSPLMLHRNLN
ncbi:Pentatricopeptide repeat-containing protein, mitochondrial [Vitis vinifera]|uniref:Pentatricopeptide repeat-containing protein, mitochondrial n=1 Tax=Vitis vinifera TaxID=29760 RepID=A0A438JFQ2_VITVI|nr:Pentatricopeptide repeat-containing protein, mitochondrial [Vitis vinifera]